MHRRTSSFNCIQKIHEKQTIYAIFSTPKLVVQKFTCHHARYSYFLLYEKKKSVAAAAAAAAEIHPDDLSGAPGAHQSLQLDELKRFMPPKNFRQKSIFPKIAILSRLVLLCIDEFLDSFFEDGEYTPQSRCKTFQFPEIRRKKYLKICRKIRKFRLCRQTSTSKNCLKKKIKKAFWVHLDEV